MLNATFNRYTVINGLLIFFGFIFFISCDDIFEEDLTDDVIVLITPSNNDTSTIQSQLFKWEAADEAVKYRIQIASPSFAFTQTLILDSTISNTQIYFSLEPGIYQWRVKAINYSSESEFSSPFTIMIDTTSNLSNQLVVLNSPSSNADMNDTMPSFNWQSMGIADSYNIVLKSGTNWTTGTVLINDTITANAYNSLISLSEGQYIWGVRAINSLSFTSSFNQRTLNIDLTNPPKPVPTSPANSSSQTQGLLNFTWTRPADLGTYNSSRYDSLYIFSDTAMTVSLGKYYSLNTNFSVNINQSDSFFWYLIGFDNAGNRSDTSNVFSFSIP
jgi:hypothetical protein